MFEDVTYITSGDYKWPIKCDLIVLEKAQETFGSIRKFEQMLMDCEYETNENGENVLDDNGNPKIKAKLPDVSAVNTALYWMACEGRAVMADEAKSDEMRTTVDKDKLLRSMDMPFMKLARILHEEFARCFVSKNEKTTQD